MKWITCYPKMGGLSLGFQKVFGNPEMVIQNGKDDNDKHYFLNNPDVPIKYVNDFDEEIEIEFEPDIFVGLPGCAGLSSLGHNHDEKKSFEYSKNLEIINIIQMGIKLKSKVVVIEQTNGLFSNKGDAIVEKMKMISREYNYGMQIIFTNCLNHGIPQHRPRTFVIFYKDGNTYKFKWEMKECKSVSEYLSEIDKNSEYYNDYYNNIDLQILENIKSYFNGKSIQDISKELFQEREPDTLRALDIIRKIGVKKFLEQTGNEISPKYKKYLNKVINDEEIGKGSWDSTPVLLISDKRTRPIITKNMATVHPNMERILNIREKMHLMGLPEWYKLADVKEKYIHISRNVPVNVQEYIARQIKLYFDGKLDKINQDFLRQNNVKQEMEFEKRNTNFLTQLGV